MTNWTTQKDMLEEIESIIDSTKQQMQRLKRDFASLMMSGEITERRLILQQLHILEDVLKVLKVRRMFALEMVLQRPLDHSQTDHRTGITP
jgi:hypothetical protein